MTLAAADDDDGSEEKLSLPSPGSALLSRGKLFSPNFCWLLLRNAQTQTFPRARPPSSTKCCTFCCCCCCCCFHPQSCWSVHQKGDDRERPEGGTLPGVIQSGARALSFCSLSHVARKRRLVLERFALFSKPLAHELHLKNAKILPRFY